MERLRECVESSPYYQTAGWVCLGAAISAFLTSAGFLLTLNFTYQAQGLEHTNWVSCTALLLSFLVWIGCGASAFVLLRFSEPETSEDEVVMARLQPQMSHAPSSRMTSVRMERRRHIYVPPATPVPSAESRLNGSDAAMKTFMGMPLRD